MYLFISADNTAFTLVKNHLAAREICRKDVSRKHRRLRHGPRWLNSLEDSKVPQLHTMQRSEKQHIGFQEKPVRRRPPRSLQLPNIHGDEQERPAGVTSPVKAKRNSALIEKLQANLDLSPSALLPSPKSPGFRLLPPFTPPPSPSSKSATSSSTLSPSSPTSTCLLVTEVEGPTSFETLHEASLLTNINKSRARHSLRRRPPSRRHRNSSSGDEVGEAPEQIDTTASQPDRETTERDKGEGVFKDGNGDHVIDSKSDNSQKNCAITSEEDQKSEDAVTEAGGTEEKSSGDDQNNNQEEQKSNTSVLDR
ncbi:duboraya isoform X2 [Nerophis ophidion]|uniref:duboraya isoform X2 n=1 Tax=Nerophis ophidion TaxID=159077 RepID=UPI002ADF1A07|nr:duboraya isoform X2 [Nerophis ophidion]